MQMVFAGVLAALMAFAPGLTGVGDLAPPGAGGGNWSPATRPSPNVCRWPRVTGDLLRVPVTEFGSCDLR